MKPQSSLAPARDRSAVARRSRGKDAVQDQRGGLNIRGRGQRRDDTEHSGQFDVGPAPTTVRATTAAAVPLCFGYHPYLTIPGVPRDEWRLTTPALRHLPVDRRGIPTGEHEPWDGGTRPLQGVEYDDGFDQVPDGAVFALEGGDRRIEVAYETGYPAAQLFAPPGQDLIGIEPMAAPTDALRRGGYRSAAPGKPETARFSIRVR
jgi:aldose 1-epimerase